MNRRLDYFYEEIKTLFKNVREICGQCKKNVVETKMDIKDTYQPTFVIIHIFSSKNDHFRREN